jgi:hypothetical protein
MDNSSLSMSGWELRAPFESLLAHLARHEWTCEADEARKRFKAGFATSHAIFHVHGEVNETDDFLQVLTVFPCRVPAGKRVEVAEFCVRFNTCFDLGKIVFDYDEGELGFLVSAPFERGWLCESTMECLLGGSLQMVEVIYPALMSLLHGNCSAREAMGQVHQATSCRLEEDEQTSWCA